MLLFKNSKITKLKFLISVLLALWGLVLFGYNYSQATVINKSNATAPNLKNGLMDWYTFDGPNVTTSTVQDVSGNGSAANRIDGVKMVVGKIGQAVTFDGTDEDTGNSALWDTLTFNTPVLNTSTIAFWYKTNTTSLPNSHKMMINGSANASGATYISLSTICGTICPFVSFRLGLVQQTLSSFAVSATAKVNQWTHVAITWDGTFIRMYINGVLNNTSANLAGSSALAGFDGVSAYIGRYGSAQGYEMNGSMDDIRFYNRAISPAEIMELYKVGGGKISKTDTTKPTLKTGLVGHWTFDGADTTLVTSTDKSGNGNNGTRSATGTTAVIGKIGQAMKFSGDVGRDVVVTTSASLNPTSSLSVAAWVKTTDTTGIIINKDDGGTNRQYSLLMNSGVAFYAFQAQATFSNTTAIGISDGKWHFIVGTINVSGDGKARMYIDGILRDTGSTVITSIATSALAATIGDRPTNGFALQGTIDDARIYNRALSSDEIVELYKMGGGKINKTDLVKPDLRSGLVGHWTFDGADMTAVTSTDRSGQGNDGTRTAVTPIMGKIGQAMKFNGSSSRINVGNPASLQFTSTSFSFSAWIKITDASAISTIIGRGNPYNNNGTGWIFVYRGDIAAKTLDFYMNNGSGSNIAPSVPLGNISGKWHQVAFTVNRTGNFIAYVDGVLRGQSDASGENGTIANANLYIGEYGEASIGYFNGLMDDVRLYNRVLSGAEMMELYRMGR